MGSAYAIEPKSTKISNLNFTPQISLTQGYTDNLLDSHYNEEHTLYTRITPKFELSQNIGLNEYALSYQITHLNYSAEASDNYTNQKFSGKALLDFDTRHRLNLNAGYAYNFEERGDGFSVGFAEVLKQPTASETSNIKSTYTYGAREAQANIDFNLGFSKVRWESLYIDDFNTPEIDNDLDFTGNREYDQKSIGTKLNYKLGAFTKVTLNTSISDVDYNNERNNEASLDSRSSSAFVGFEWQGSAITTGFINIGVSNKQFDDEGPSDTSGLRWQAGVLWTPLTYSNFDFSTARNVSETRGQGSYIDNTNYSVNWHHQWLSRLSTKFGFIYSTDDYGDTNRVDINRAYSAAVNYTMLRNLDFSITFFTRERESNYKVFNIGNNKLLDYRLNQLELSINASF